MKSWIDWLWPLSLWCLEQKRENDDGRIYTPREGELLSPPPSPTLTRSIKYARMLLEKGTWQQGV